MNRMDDSRSANERTIGQLFDLTGRVALVTGGCGHLGSAMCRALAEAGASVIVTSRDAARREPSPATLPHPGAARHHGIALDHMQADSLETSFRQAVTLAGSVDILVSNGHEALSVDWTTVTAAEFSRQLSQCHRLLRVVEAGARRVPCCENLRRASF